MATAVDPEKLDGAAQDEDCRSRVMDEAEHALADRQSWVKLQREWYTVRYGMRAKKKFPWPGASNLHIPLTDKVIRRVKPIFISSFFGVDPICTMEPLGNTTQDAARVFELGYDWLVRHRMERPQEELTFAVDDELEGGFGIIKCVWEYRSRVKDRRLKVDWVPREVSRKEYLPPAELELDLVRRCGLDPDDKRFEEQGKAVVSQFLAGDEELVWEIEDVEYNAPRWYHVAPEDLILPWDATCDIDAQPWVAHRMFLNKHELQDRARSGRYDRAAVTTALESNITGGALSDPASELEQRKQLREGVDGKGGRTDSRHEVWELYYRDDEGDKRVATIHRASKEVLRDVPYPYEHGQWPFTRFSFELNDDRWYASRGVPSLLWDLQREINAQHNAKVDNMAISTSKSFIYRNGAIRNPSKFKFRPGAMFGVPRTNDLVPIQHQQTDWVHEREEMALRMLAEEYVGTPDFGISNINQRVERRTATEIDQIQMSSGLVAEEALRRNQWAAKRLHRQTILLWQQYGDDQVVVRVTGSEESVVFVRFDLLKEFDIVPNGRIDNLNAAQRAQQAMGVLQLTESSAGRFINQYEVVKDVLENLNYRSSKRYLMAPGVWEQDAVLQQIHEISMAEKLGEVPPVDQSDAHQIHVATLERAIPQMTDERVALLMIGHLALHAFFLGEKGMLEQFIQQTGARPVEAGTRLMLELPQEEAQGAPTGDQGAAQGQPSGDQARG